jgi:gliding motility-associated-like protein
MRIYFTLLCFLALGLFSGQYASAQAVQGNDFWFMLPSNFDQGNSTCNSNYRLILVSQFCVENEIVLTSEALNLSNTYSIESGEYFEIDLSQLPGIPANNIITPTPNFADGDYSDISFHLTSPQPVQAFLFVDRGLSAEGETLLPTRLLGNDYVPAMRGFSINSIETHILATEDNTSIDINGFGGVGQQTIVLNQGEIFSFLTDESCDPDVTFFNGCITMDGTVINSDKKVAIFASNRLAQMGNAGNGDMIMQTFLPINNWSNEYFTAQNIERKALVGNNIGAMNGAGDYIQITGAIGTTVTIEYNNNPARVETITAPTWGNYGYGYIFLDLEEMTGVGYYGDANTYITANSPIQISQYTKGSFSDSFQGTFDATKADPEAHLVLPNELWEESYIFYQIASREEVPQCFSGVSDFAELQTLVIILDDTPINGQLPSENVELNGVNVGSAGWIPFSPGSSKKMRRIVYGNTESTTVVSKIGAPLGINFYGSRERHSAIFSGGYGPIEEVNLCDQCADFDIQQNASACIGETVPFAPVIYSFSLPNSLNYSWSFGDGTTSSEKEPVKVYTETGVFTVTLVISDNVSDCDLTYTKTVYVNEVDAEILLGNKQDSLICSFDEILAYTKDTLNPEGRQRVQITNGDSIAIPDAGLANGNNNLAKSIIDVDGTYPAGAYVDSICLNIQHPRVDELYGFIETPWGARYDLFTDLTTTGRGNMRKTCFSPSAVDLMRDVQPPYTGTFVESNTISTGADMWDDILVKSPSGLWTLNVGDNLEFNSGFIADWSVYVNTDNGIKVYDWFPKNLLVADVNNDSALFNPPTDTGRFEISVDLETFNGCVNSDTLELWKDRDPIVFEQIDTVVCSTSDSIVLDSVFSSYYKDFRTGGFYMFIGNQLDPVYSNGVFYPSEGENSTYTIRYIYQYQCGLDSASIKIKLNVLPVLGPDSLTAVCGTFSQINLNDYLQHSEAHQGKWTSSPILTNTELDSLTGVFRSNIITPGVYNTRYTIDLQACAPQSVGVVATVVRQLSPGLNNDTLLCEKASGLDLLALLNGNPDDLGTWTETNFGATVSDNIFDLRDRSTTGITTYNFVYEHSDQSPCADTSSQLVVNISNAPTAELIPDFPVVCRDSAVNITVNITGDSPGAGYDLTISDGSNIYPDNHTNVHSGVSFSATLSSATVYSVIELRDNTALRCPSYEDIQLEVKVFDQLIVDLVEEKCQDDFSFFTPIIEIRGGDDSGYLYDLYVNGILVKKDELVTALPLAQDSIANGSIYEYRFTDLSNCEDSRTSFLREPAKYCECVTYPGNMDRTPLDLCEDVTAVTAETKNAFIETIAGSEDTLFYILHNTGGIIEGIVYDTNTVPEFDFIPGVLNYDVEYYISAIAGDKIDGFGYIDPLDTCIAVNQGTPVTWRRKPTLDNYTPATTVCFGEPASISYAATGKAPFTLIGKYQIDGAPTMVDTSLVLDNNTGTLIFNLPSSRTFFITKIVDANNQTINLDGGTTCDNIINEVFRINVNPLPVIEFTQAGPLIGCEGDVLIPEFTLTGQVPFEFSYKRFGTIIQEVNYLANAYAFSVTQSGFIELLNVSDATGCIGTIEGNKVLTTEFRKKPVAKVLTENVAICGNQVDLEASPSHGTGIWTSEMGGTVGNPNTPITTGIANYSDTVLTFIWTETNPPCPASQDSVEVYFRLDPAPFAGDDDTICGNQYTFKAEESISASRGSRSWIQIGGDDAVFDNPNDPNATITVANNGLYSFVYIESVDGVCVNSDTVNLTFVSAPQIVVLDTICDNISQYYTIRYTIVSNFIDKVETNGEPYGNIYQIVGLSGTAISIEAKLAVACEPVATQSVFYECPCLTTITGFRSDTVKVCYKDVFSFTDVPRANLDGNDTLVYVLKESDDPNNLTDVIYSHAENKYDFDIPNLQYGKVYYAMALAGNIDRNNTVGIDFNDPCRVSTFAVPVIIQEDYMLSFPSDVYFCEGEVQEIEVFGIPEGINITVTTSVDGFIGSSVVSKASPFISISSPLGTSYVEIGELSPDNGFKCAQKNLGLIKVEVHQLPTINFELDQKVCVGEKTTLKLNSSFNQYEIIVDAKDTLKGKTNIYSYDNPGNSVVSVSLLGDFGCDAQQDFNVSVQAAPEPEFVLPPALCFPGPIEAQVVGSNPDVSNRQWVVNGAVELGNLIMSHTPMNPGTYVIALEEITSNGCIGKTTKEVFVSSPEADLAILGDSICSSELLKLEFFNPKNVDNFSWKYSGYLTGNSTSQNVFLDLENGDLTNTDLYVDLELFDNFGCFKSIKDTVRVNYVKANFNFAKNIYCENDLLATTNLSINGQDYVWDVENAATIYAYEVFDLPIKSKDSILVKLVTSNPVTGCSDEYSKYLEIAKQPSIVSDIDTVCKNIPARIRVSGADYYEWSPKVGLDSYLGAGPIVLTNVERYYTVTGTFVNGCTSSINVTVPVHESVDPPAFYSYVGDYAIGDTVGVNFVPDPGYDIFWVDSFGDTVCVNCTDSLFTLFDDVFMTVTAKDVKGCFSQESEIALRVTEKYTVDFPDAFTPNGDGINDFIQPQGLGIEEYLSIQYFDREGAMVFNGGGENVSWDGKVKGKKQELGTYTYKVIARFYFQENVEIITGTFQLIR